MTRTQEEAEHVGEAKGKAKEAYGAMTGDEGKKSEGRAQQRRATAEKRDQHERT